MLPPSYIPWLVRQPEILLSAKWAQIDAVEATTTMLRSTVASNPVHEEIIKRELKLHLDSLIPEMMDEIQSAMDQLISPNESGFQEFNLDETIRETITRVSNRAFVGLPLCELRSVPGVLLEY